MISLLKADLYKELKKKSFKYLVMLIIFVSVLSLSIMRFILFSVRKNTIMLISMVVMNIIKIIMKVIKTLLTRKIE